MYSSKTYIHYSAVQYSTAQCIASMHAYMQACSHLMSLISYIYIIEQSEKHSSKVQTESSNTVHTDVIPEAKLDCFFFTPTISHQMATRFLGPAGETPLEAVLGLRHGFDSRRIWKNGFKTIVVSCYIISIHIPFLFRKWLIEITYQCPKREDFLDHFLF